MRIFKIVERENPLALHAIFECRSRAEYHLKYNIPAYIERGYFSDKTLKAKDFIIVER